MSDERQRNRREDFRIDDVLKMRDEALSDSEFEARKKRLDGKSSLSSSLRELMAREDHAEGNASLYKAEFFGELVRAIEAIDSKLDYLISINMIKESDCEHLEDREVNLSSTGMGFITDQRYEVGKPVQIRFAIPIFPPQVVELLAEVKWVKPGNNERLEVGVSFHFRDSDEVENVARYVFERHRKMLRLE